MTEILADTAIGAGIGAAVTGGATAVVSALGFSSGGVVAGSTAAVIQAGIGNVAAGSAFAAFQSVAATGVVATVGPVALGAGVLGGVGYGVYKALV